MAEIITKQESIKLECRMCKKPIKHHIAISFGHCSDCIREFLGLLKETKDDMPQFEQGFTFRKIEEDEVPIW